MKRLLLQKHAEVELTMQMSSQMCSKAIHFGSPNTLFWGCKLNQNQSFLVHGIKSCFWVVLASVRDPILRSFGMHDGGAGRPKSVCFGLKQSPSVFEVTRGRWGSFSVSFGSSFGCPE